MDYFFESKTENIRAQIHTSLDFGAHLHEHIELGFLLSGSTDLYLEDNKYHLKSGDFFIVFPNQIHRYEQSHEVRAYMIIYSPALVPEFHGLFSKNIPQSPIISGNNSAAKRLTGLFFEEYNSISAETVRGFILALTGMLFKNIEFIEQDKYNISTLKNILIYCNEHYTDSITIENVADSLHISRSHISHIFKNKLNTTFGNYICAKRVNYACGLLKNSAISVTESAFASGFDSVRTFNRTFVKYTGRTPREYRKNQGEV